MRGIWEIIKTFGKFIQGLGTLTLGFIVILGLVLIMSARGPQPAPKVPDGAVLILEPNGDIVEQAEFPDPLEELLPEYQRTPPQTSIYDITEALKRAKNDDRIAAVALLTDYMGGVGPSHLHTIAASLRDFKESGKKLYAISSSYSQGAYMLAAEADKIYMHQQGAVFLTGYASYPMYFKSMLEKIGAEVNVFRVGTYKSAVEPFIRDDMSPAAKEANMAFLNSLWEQYTSSVETARGLEAGAVQAGIVNASENLRQAGGRFGQMAVDGGLVDETSARKTWRQALVEEYGANKQGNSFKQIHYQAYLAATDSAQNGGRDIAVITAQGPIVMGNGPITVTAAETVVGHIRSARNNPATAAIVLRIDSPGGSSFASELIRQELVAAQESGIKVIASMGPVAASGGYWIASTADEIWAAPSTITGSIGIFGIIQTFEDTLKKVGISADGVGTTPLAGAFDIRRPMSDMSKDIVQQAIEAGYDEFLTLVAQGRSMTVEDVDKIAQGRVWAGTTAKELGLVDHLGGFDEAVAAAASAVGIEDYSLVFYREQPDPFDQMLADILNSTVGLDNLGTLTGAGINPVMQQALDFKQELEFLSTLNDPMARYAICFECKVN